jgi:hypothetical protein
MTAKGHFVHDLAVLGVRIAGCPRLDWFDSIGIRGRSQPPFLSSMDIRDVFARNLCRIRDAKGLCRRKRWRTRPTWTGPISARSSTECTMRASRRSQDLRMCWASNRTNCRGVRRSQAEPTQIHKRRSRVTMTIELSALATVLQAATCCDAKLTDEAVSLKRLLCIMAEGHLVFISPGLLGLRGVRQRR